MRTPATTEESGPSLETRNGGARSLTSPTVHLRAPLYKQEVGGSIPSPPIEEKPAQTGLSLEANPHASRLLATYGAARPVSRHEPLVDQEVGVESLPRSFFGVVRGGKRRAKPRPTTAMKPRRRHFVATYDSVTSPAGSRSWKRRWAACFVTLRPSAISFHE